MANCMQAVIGIGSNMGDRLKNINGAVRSLSRLPKTKITACSHVYETRPVGYEAQPLFYNAAIIVETELSAQMLLGACVITESELLFGAIFNRTYAVWDYRGLRHNYRGQICPQFFCCWLFVALLAVFLDDGVRYVSFGEALPRYTLF